MRHRPEATGLLSGRKGVLLPPHYGGRTVILSRRGLLSQTRRRLPVRQDSLWDSLRRITPFGIQTYDESFTINAADGELLGACGMGINESVDRAAADSDQVRLLDIWLYDRSAVSSVSQPLVSPGFDASGLGDYAESSGSDSSPPLEVVPGLTCALQSDRIELECTIKSASFLDGEQTPIPFRSVSVSLAVYVQS